eukprot:TRINITY_DN10519_c0_g1_i1.p1 TRINITY_DN10519_c0_g1~~TRINITY_DN10519_c0_g1_i1.p1  ORF type:complete len:630 (-),score=144.18 TRINITY_DN10519_c0_g1_i1:205-2094(-)
MSCGCVEGLRRLSSGRRSVAPDVPPAEYMLRGGTVRNFEEAFALSRPQMGTWVPNSPSLAPYITPAWASPVPRLSDQEGGGDLDFDLIIDECDANEEAQGTIAAQLDTDQRPFGPGGRPRTRSKFEVEQLLASPGRLPAPMSTDRREAAIRSLLPTATFQMLSKVPPALLGPQSDQKALEKAQQLRRKLSYGATLVIVSAGLPGKRFTFERAAALGIKIVILEHHDSWSKALVAEGVVAKFIPVDMSQSSDKVYADCLARIQELGQDNKTGRVDGIATFVELSVPLVARLCEALGLPGHRPQAVDDARDKHATRACLKAAGLPTPRNSLIHTLAEVEAAGKLVGFPAVLKPVSGAASLGVRKVTDMAELKRCYKEVVDELSSLVVCSGALVKGDSNNAGVTASGVTDLTVLLEQFLDGVEIDCDIVMTGGEYVYAAVADNGPTLEPYFNETWAVCPSLLPKDQQKELRELSVDCVKALGFTAGVFHVECKYTSTGPQLIEVNCRMGGGQVHECNLRTWGVCLVEETLFAALGIPARPAVPARPLCSVAYCYVNAKRSGKAQDISGLEAIMKRQGVVWAKPLVKQGAKVVGPEEGLPTWLCDLFVTGATSKAALAFLQELEASDPVKVTC